MFVVMCYIISRIIYHHIAEPYMDEIFHIPQTQKFCNGKWTEYHPLISTLPGLYLPPAMFSRMIQLHKPLNIPFVVNCSSTYLRFFNLLYIICAVPLIQTILQHLHPIFSMEIINHFTLEILLFPIHFFFIFLFYTEIPSTFWLLCSYLCYIRIFKQHAQKNRRKCEFCAFITAVIAILHRQTNVVWIGFYFLLAIFDLYSTQMKSNGRKNIKSLMGNIVSLMHFCWKFKMQLIFHDLYHYILVFVGFLYFVIVWNEGSVAVGDQSHHRISEAFHLAQILYFIIALFIFAMIPSFFFWLRLLIINREILKMQVRRFSHWFLLLMIIFSIFRWRFTFDHPFLLSDNRHFSFYVWRYFLSRQWFSFLLVPMSAFSFIFICSEFESFHGWNTNENVSIHKWWLICFVICSSCVLILTPLFEFRYFILPVIIFKLNYFTNIDILSILKRKRATTLPVFLAYFLIKYWNIVVFFIMDIIIMYTFIFKPFAWNDHSVARFMW